MLDMVKLVVPVFLSATVSAALVVPTAWVEKVRLTGDRVALGPEVSAGSFVTGNTLPVNRAKPSRGRSSWRTGVLSRGAGNAPLLDSGPRACPGADNLLSLVPLTACASVAALASARL